MTRQKKAKELVENARIALNINKYTYLRNPIWPDRCCRIALMAVDEIIENYKEIEVYFTDSEYGEQTDYWKEVKEEIEKL